MPLIGKYAAALHHTCGKKLKRFQFEHGSNNKIKTARKRSGINSLPLSGVWGRVVHTYLCLGLLVSGMNVLVHTHAAYLHFQPDGDISEMRGYKSGAVAGISPRLLSQLVQASQSAGGPNSGFSQLSSQQKTCLLVLVSVVKVMISRGCPRVQSHSVEVGLVKKNKRKPDHTGRSSEVLVRRCVYIKSNKSGSSFTALISQVKGVAVHAALVMAWRGNK